MSFLVFLISFLVFLALLVLLDTFTTSHDGAWSCSTSWTSPARAFIRVVIVGNLGRRLLDFLTLGTSLAELFLELHLATFGHFDGDAGLVCLISGSLSHHFDDILSTFNSAEDHVLAIEPWAGLKSDEELRAIGIGSCIRHGEQIGFRVPNLEVLISKLLSINTLATCAIELGEIASLCHEIWDHTMETTVLIMKHFAWVASSRLASAELSKVFGCARHNILKQLKDYGSFWLITDAYVEINARVIQLRLFCCRHILMIYLL